MLLTCALLIEDGQRCVKTGDCSNSQAPPASIPPNWGGPASPFPTLAPLLPIGDGWPFKPSSHGFPLFHSVGAPSMDDLVPSPGMAFLTPYQHSSGPITLPGSHQLL